MIDGEVFGGDEVEAEAGAIKEEVGAFALVPFVGKELLSGKGRSSTTEPGLPAT